MARPLRIEYAGAVYRCVVLSPVRARMVLFSRRRGLYFTRTAVDTCAFLTYTSPKEEMHAT